MDVILKVLEGAKSGAKVAIKRPKFIIGRSQDCQLCAGSSAISRQHCAILRDESRVSITDLGSRNGTWVNGTRISGETELTSGDEITVGPLKFLLTITPGINNAKKPEVKTVAQAVERTSEGPRNDASIDDISQWLLAPETSALNETQTIRIDDTNAAKVDESVLDADTTAMDAAPESPSSAGSQSGKSGDKKAPGKLPKFAQQMAKDSREAAAEALRAWSRRR